MLLSMCFFPLFFKPPVQHGSASMRPSTRPELSAASSQPRILPLADDPLVLSQRQIRQLARDLLADVIGTCGIEVVCDAIKGYGMPLAEGGGSASRADSEEPSTHKYFGKKHKGKKSSSKLGQDHPDFETPVDSDDPLAAAANLMLDAPDLWEVLAGTTAVKRRLRTSEKPVIDTGGWEVLRELVRGWEAEAIRKKAADDSGEGQSFAIPLPYVSSQLTPANRRASCAVEPVALLQTLRIHRRRSRALDQSPRRRLLAVLGVRSRR